MGAASLRKLNPEDDKTGSRIPSAHIGNEFYLFWGMLIRMGVRSSGAVAQRVNRTIITAQPAIDMLAIGFVFDGSLDNAIFVSVLNKVQAAEDSITDGEIIALCAKACELFELVYHDASPYIDQGGEPVFLERNGHIVKYLPAKEGMTDYAYWEELAQTIYTDHYYQYAIEHGRGTGHMLGMLTNHEGKAYFLENTPVNWQPIIYPTNFDSMQVGGSNDQTGCWMEKRDPREAFGYLRLDNASEKYQGALVPLILSVSFIYTENGWRINGGSLADLFCPSHTGERSERPNKYFMYYPLLYTQIAEYSVQDALQTYFQKDIIFSSLQIIECSADYERIENSDGTLSFSEQGTYAAKVLASTEGLFDNKPFVITLMSKTLYEDWKADVRSIEVDGKNPITADNTFSLLIIGSAFILCGSSILRYRYQCLSKGISQND